MISKYLKKKRRHNGFQVKKMRPIKWPMAAMAKDI